MNDYLNKVRTSSWKNCESILEKPNFDIIFSKIEEAILKHEKDHPGNQSGGSGGGSSNKITLSKKSREPTLYAVHRTAWFEENAPDKDDELEKDGETYKRNKYYNEFVWGPIKDNTAKKEELATKYGLNTNKSSGGGSSKSSTLNALQVFDRVHRPLFPDKVTGLKNPKDGADISLYRAIQIVWKELGENKEHKKIHAIYKEYSDGLKEANKNGTKFEKKLSDLPHLPTEVFQNMDFDQIKLVN